MKKLFFIFMLISILFNGCAEYTSINYINFDINTTENYTWECYEHGFLYSTYDNNWSIVFAKDLYDGIYEVNIMRIYIFNNNQHLKIGTYYDSNIHIQYYDNSGTLHDSEAPSNFAQIIITKSDSSIIEGQIYSTLDNMYLYGEFRTIYTIE